MARRGLVVLLLASALLLAVPAFTGLQSTLNSVQVAREAVVGTDSQGRYRFTVDGVIMEAPTGGSGSSLTSTLLGLHFILFVVYKVLEKM